MTSTQHMRNVSGGTGSMEAVHLLLAEGDIKLMVENPEQVMEEIRLRATQVGSILEGILHEPHGRPDWGIND
jgi:hypothetical protein